MPDITMCGGTACPLKATCYRYTARPTPGRQSYFANAPVRYRETGDAVCDYYWTVDGDTK